MTDVPALLSGLFALLTVVVYAYLGWRLGRRPTSPELRLPAFQFSLFWYCLAAVQTVSMFESFYAAVQLPSLVLVVTLFHLQLLILCVLLWALISYLIYLFTGQSYLVPISVLYAVCYLILQYFVTASGPYTVTLTYGVVGLTSGSNAPVGTIYVIVLVALLVVPELVSTMLYFSLFFRTHDRTLRFRIGLVSWALLLFFTVSILNGSGGLAATILNRVIGVIAAFVILIAYFPPRMVQERLDVRTVEARPLVTGAALTEGEGTVSPKPPGEPSVPR